MFDLKFVIRCGAMFLLTIASTWAQSSFAPLTKWTEAVSSGSPQTVRALYSSNPPAVTVVGKEQTREPDRDAAFWAGLKAEGVSNIHPKVLSFERQNGEVQLVLRVQAERFGQTLVASVVQVWMQQPDGWRIVATQRSPFVPDNGRRLPEPAKPNTALYGTPQQSIEELKHAMAEAAREHKRVLVVFGANWCYDCHVLDATFHSPAFAPLVERNYVVVHLSIGDEGKDNNDLAARLGVNLDKGVPALAVLDPNGKVLTEHEQSEFHATTKIGPEDVRAFLEKYKPAH